VNRIIWKSTALGLVLVSVFLGSACSTPRDSLESGTGNTPMASMILFNGAVYTVDDAQPWANWRT
jgi:hypothetical protein